MLNTQSTMQTSPTRPASSLEAESQADSLLERAQESQTEQAALLESSPLESNYSAALAAYIDAKHDQVERIEDRLEALIAQQTIRLVQTQDSRPGRVSLPSTKANWQQQMLRQQATIQRLHDRLEEVREIRDGMGVHGPKLEELAARKLRAQEPDLAADWDEMRAAQRGHQAMLCKQEHDRRRRLSEEHGQGHGQGRSLGLTLNQAR